MRSIWHMIKGDTPEESLHVATANERLEDMRSLLASGVDVNTTQATIMSGQNVETALHLASTNGLVAPAHLLIEAGADLDRKDGMDLTPLMCACSCGGQAGSEIALALISAGADVTYIRESDEMSALKFAAKGCSAQTIQALIDNGSDVDGPKGTRQTALMLAARSNNVPALEVLIKNGANAQLSCGLPWAKGNNAAWLAQNEGSDEAFEYLSAIGKAT